MGCDLALPVAFIKSSGWWGPAHGGTHKPRAMYQENDAGGSSGDAFGVVVSRKGKEAKYEVDPGFFAWLGEKPNPIWADLERLQAKHPDQFTSPDDVHKHIMAVLSNPWVALPASEMRYLLLLSPLANKEHQAAVIRFELRGYQYRVRSAHRILEKQAAEKIQRAEESALRRRGRQTTFPASSGDHISPQGTDAGLTRRPPAKLNKSMADRVVFFKAQAVDWLQKVNMLSKSYIHGHYRKNPKTGEMTWIESYSDQRQTRQGPTVFAHDLHRQDHVKHHLAAGRLREAMHGFHDLDHDGAHHLAESLGLHSGPQYADKKTLMQALHAKLHQEVVPDSRNYHFTPSPPDASMDDDAVMASAERNLGSESVFEIFDYLPDRKPDDLRWSSQEMYRAIFSLKAERRHSRHDKTKQSLLAANDGSPLGLEIKKPDSNRHALILPDATQPGKYRYSAYDEGGFYTHSTHDTADKALDEAIKEGFTEHAPGSLDRLSQTEAWAQGMARADAAQNGWKPMAKSILFITKSFIPAHTRKLASGKVVQVQAYNNRQFRHGEDGGTRDMFSQADKPANEKPETGSDHLFDQDAHGPQVRYHVTAAGAAIAKEGFKPMTTGGVGVAGGTDGHTFTYRDRQDANNLLVDLGNMESVRVASDPIAVAAKLTGMSQETILKAGDRLKEGWDQYFRKKLGGRDCTDRDVALHSASNYVPFTSFASVTGPRRAFGIVPVDVSHAQRIGGEKDGEERWDSSTIKPILKDAAGQPKETPKADLVSMSKKELIAEHEKLVAVLKSPDHADDLKEAKEQEQELKGYKGKVKSSSAPSNDEDPDKLKNQLEMVEDMLKDNPKSNNAPAWEARVKSLRAKLGLSATATSEPESEEPGPEAVDQSGWSGAKKAAYALSKEYEDRRYDVQTNRKLAANFKNRLQALAKKTPEDDEHAVFWLDALYLKLYGDYDIKQKSLKYAPPGSKAETVTKSLFPVMFFKVHHGEVRPSSPMR